MILRLTDSDRWTGSKTLTVTEMSWEPLGSNVPSIGSIDMFIFSVTLLGFIL